MKKLLIIGDSISAGLGSKKINFTNELQNFLDQTNLQVIVKNKSVSGLTILDINNLEIINEKPNILFLMIGNVDLQKRPSRDNFIYKFLLPNYFKSEGMLSPRPYYSKSLAKKLLNIIDNIIRSFYRNLIYLFFKKYQKVDFLFFIKEYERLLMNIKRFLPKTDVYIFSTIYLSDKFFPGTLDNYLNANDFLKKQAYTFNFYFIDIFNFFKPLEKSFYAHDLFHPSTKGYRLLAFFIFRILYYNLRYGKK